MPPDTPSCVGGLSWLHALFTLLGLGWLHCLLQVEARNRRVCVCVGGWGTGLKHGLSFFPDHMSSFQNIVSGGLGAVLHLGLFGPLQFLGCSFLERCWFWGAFPKHAGKCSHPSGSGGLLLSHPSSSLSSPLSPPAVLPHGSLSKLRVFW